ncbi:MAG TPA: hypothetical protein VGW12_22080 [Pyrinomonadaceae bacterium]|nr:hypothetical protein [Pyrinomonadaceae bacterium]
MPTKASTKSKKAKGESQPQLQQAITASHLNLGPPFAGPGPFPHPAMWSQFPYPDGRRVPCPGFWGFVRHYPTVGGFVAQLGAEPATGLASCALYTGYRYTFTATLTGYHIIVLTLVLGQMTRRPRYGEAQITAVLYLTGAGGYWPDYYPGEVPSNTGITLSLSPLLIRGAVYTLNFWVTPIVYNVGYQSYGEAIVERADLKMFLPLGAQAGELARPEPTIGNALLGSVINAADELEAQPISLEEAATLGVGYSS